MDNNLLKFANAKYISGYYEEALEAYEKASKIYGEDIFFANLKMCRKKIKEKNSGEKIFINQCISDVGSFDEVLRIGLGIDKIYIVNLNRRPDRFLRAIREMNTQGLSSLRVEGVDAKYSTLAKELFEDFKSRPVSNKKKSSSHVSISRLKRFKDSLTVGAFGYLLSQKKVFEDAKKNEYRKILVLDDDVFWHSEAKKKIYELSQKIGHNYKLLLLGSSEYTDRNSEEFSSAFFKEYDDLYHPIPDRTCGSFAVAYDQSIYDEVLDAIAEADGPFDNVVLGSFYSKFRKDCFSVTPAICIPDVDESDIRKSERTQISHSERMNWETKRFREFKRDLNIGVIANSFFSLDSVEKINKSLFPGINVSVFYPSNDGFRPVILGHHFHQTEEKVMKLDLKDAVSFRSLLDEFNLPSADIYISWPDEKEITRDSIIHAASKALQDVNKNMEMDGVFDNHFYSAQIERGFKKGRHSIIIPCFRSIDEALPAIQSALLQDVNDFEVIVVNDNSDTKGFGDLLRKKLMEWARSINKIKILDHLIVIEHKKNRNASAARNTGFFQSTGEWISFLDDDDYFEPNRLSAIESILSSSGDEVGACYCGYTGNWNGHKNLDRFPEGNLREMVITLKYGEHYMCTNTVTFKRIAFERLNGFDEGYKRHQDIELMARFFEIYEIKSVKKFLVKNRPSPVSSTFVADLDSLSRLKLKFLKDLAPTLDKKNNSLMEALIDAHVSDILKRKKDSSEDIKIIARSMLKEVLL